MKEKISVCVATFHRNGMLEKLLQCLSLQETGGLFEIAVCVVDNDASGPARQTVNALAARTGLPISYAIEPEQTIPAARNHALRLADGRFIAIIDDDEFAPQQWLITLYRNLVLFDVDGCLGPVLPYFEQTPPAWLIKSRFCERPILRTGTLLHWSQTRTGNVLLKRAVFDRHRLRFDPRLKTGGSDREFFKQAMRVGCRFLAVEEAPVYETVPVERWKKSYYLRRAIVNGSNAHRNGSGELRGLSKARLVVKSLCALLAYLVAAPFAALLGSHLLMLCLEKGSHHLSRLLAMCGIDLIKARNF